MAGTTHHALTSRALELVPAQQGIPSAGGVFRPRRRRNNPNLLRGTTRTVTEEHDIIINRSALRSAKPAHHTEGNEAEADSDTPLIEHHKKRKKTDAHTPPGHPANDLAALQAISSWPPIQTASNKSSSPATTDPTPQRKPRRKTEAFRISTALPENVPPLGQHCHCLVSADDPWLVKCDGCNKLFHPRCVGKGKFAKATYPNDPFGYMMKDKQKFENKEFKCGDCEAGFFGNR